MSKSKRSEAARKLPKTNTSEASKSTKEESNSVVSAAVTDPLKSWLPTKPFDFSRVFDPVTIDPSISHLAKYHPQDAKERPCSFRLIRTKNDQETASVDVFDLTNWDSQFVDILRLLRFRVVNIGQPNEHLLDNSIRGDLVPMAGWKVVSWTIKRSEFDANSKPTRLTDRIEWRRVDGTGDSAFSSYSWLPYKPG